MGWWQLGWITATRCCWGHQKTTLRDCSASRIVLLELSSVLRGRRLLNHCSRSCTGFQCSNVWPTRSVFWCTRPCRTRNQHTSTPYWFLMNQLDAWDRRNISCWPIDISIRQQPRERSGIPHLIPGIDWLWILVVQLHSVLLKNF